MRIIKISTINSSSEDLEESYEKLKKALQHLNLNNIGQAKKEIKKSISLLEKVRPHLKYKDFPSRRRV